MKFAVLSSGFLIIVHTTQPYHVGEKVLVESKSGEMLWDATVTAVSTRMVNGAAKMIDAYRVEYTDWGRRFVEWVNPSRVVEPSENNLQLQVSPKSELSTVIFRWS